uniref:Bm9830 n=1 Tax=Brugia malayi TaxID=6279 RepID=A0A0J9XUF7_BRUMA|nr:Bm9830 [Brugia malayi]
MASGFKITDESLDRHDSSVFGKRAKFAFAKRHPSRFAFAKRYDDEDVNYYDKKAMHFESPIHPTRNFAFAKRGPYLSFA